MKANPCLTLHEQLISFLMIQQGATESTENFLSRFNSKLKSLELAGRKHIACSPQILKRI